MGRGERLIQVVPNIPAVSCSLLDAAVSRAENLPPSVLISKEELGLEDAPKDTISRVVGGGMYREKEGECFPAMAKW